MNENVENIGRRDVIWGYAATGITVGAGVILLPFILHKLSADTVGIWNVFQTVVYLTLVIDFGFRPSFSRTISFIFTGVRTFQRDGVEQVTDDTVDYGILKATIRVMQRLYRYMAIGTLLFFLLGGTAYMYFLLNKYSGNVQDAWVAWFMLVGLNAFNLYTYYYDALLQGKGYIRQLQQINILAQSVYLLVAIALIECGLGLTAIVSAQILNIIIKRVGAYKVFYTAEMKQHLAEATEADGKPIIKAVAPNAIKSGLTGLGGMLVNRSALLIGGVFLSLEQLACYGITIQVLEILNRCATVVYQSFIPKLAECRAQKDYSGLSRYYRYNVLSIVVMFVLGGTALVLLGNWALGIIGSNTTFVCTSMLLVMLIISFLETNHATAAGFIQADNRIPFFIPSLVSGAATVALLYVFLSVFQWGLWGMILAPGIAQLCYQNWKWPSMLISEIRSGMSASPKS